MTSSWLGAYLSVVILDDVKAGKRFTHYWHRLFRRRSKPHVTDLCEGNPPVTGGFPSQRASDVENVSIWWRHHINYILVAKKPNISLSAVSKLPAFSWMTRVFSYPNPHCRIHNSVFLNETGEQAHLLPNKVSAFWFRFWMFLTIQMINILALWFWLTIGSDSVPRLDTLDTRVGYWSSIR